MRRIGSAYLIGAGHDVASELASRSCELGKYSDFIFLAKSQDGDDVLVPADIDGAAELLDRYVEHRVFNAKVQKVRFATTARRLVVRVTDL